MTKREMLDGIKNHWCKEYGKYDKISQICQRRVKRRHEFCLACKKLTQLRGER